MKLIESFDGKEKKRISCLGCAMEKEEIDFSKSTIIKTKHFDLHQDYELPIEGFLILSSRRHFTSINDFTDSERKEFFELISNARKGMKEALGIDETVFFQNEASDHHFHLWIFPFHPWMKKRGFGKRMRDIVEIIKYARENMKTKENSIKIKDSVEKMRVYFKGEKYGKA